MTGNEGIEELRKPSYRSWHLNLISPSKGVWRAVRGEPEAQHKEWHLGMGIKIRTYPGTSGSSPGGEQKPSGQVTRSGRELGWPRTVPYLNTRTGGRNLSHNDFLSFLSYWWFPPSLHMSQLMTKGKPEIARLYSIRVFSSYSALIKHFISPSQPGKLHSPHQRPRLPHTSLPQSKSPKLPVIIKQTSKYFYQKHFS